MTKRKRRHEYTIGSISHGTMRTEDLIPAFLSQLEHELKHGPKQDRTTRKRHAAIVRDVTARFDAYQADENNADNDYFQNGDDDEDLATLVDALEEYAAPYFYFGAHPGDGSDYGYWLSESWDDAFYAANLWDANNGPWSIKVSDLSEVPVKYRGEVAVVSDHGNVTLYNKTARKLTEIWGIV